jgi:hypothetical protein
MVHRLKRCRHCGQRHALRDDVVLVWCGGVLEHRARFVIVAVELELEAVAA